MKRFLLALICLIGVGCSDFALNPHAPLAEIRIEPGDTLVTSLDTVQYRLSVYDEDGEDVGYPPSWAGIEWTGSRKDDIKFLPDGRFIGLDGSEMVVAAAVAGLSAKVKLRINPHILYLDVTSTLNQTVQSLDNPIPLIAGKDALLRVFVTTEQVNFYTPSDIRVTLSSPSGDSSQVLSIESAKIAKRINEGDTKQSYLSIIPGDLIQPGLGIAIELDPMNTIPASEPRIPAGGFAKIPVLTSAVHKQVIMPVIARSTTDDVFRLLPGFIKDAEFAIGLLFPIKDVEIIQHEVFHTDLDISEYQEGWVKLLMMMNVIRDMEIGEGIISDEWFYYGALVPTYSRGVFGVAYIGQYVGVGYPGDGLFLHELGHNMGLFHAPCGEGITGVDPDYPYPDGSIGTWGYHSGEQGLIPPRASDLMGYCADAWISDYHYDKIRQNRERRLGGSPERALLVWGSLGEDGVELLPSFEINAIRRVPSGNGPYQLDIYDTQDQRIYMSRFEMDAIETEGRGGLGFSFNLPSLGEVDRIVVTGPEGRDEIGRDTEPTMAILRNPISGQVVGLYENWLPLSASALSRTPGALIITSNGVPR